MGRPLREVGPDDVSDIRLAVVWLKDVRNILVRAGAKTAVKKVRSAIKSAEGALRHAERSQMEAYHEARRIEEEMDIERVVVVKVKGD